MDWVVSPVLHIIPTESDAVSTTESPMQKARGPDAVMVGVDGRGVANTSMVSDEAERQPPAAKAKPLTDAESRTIMNAAVSPVLKTVFANEEEISKESPWQKDTGPVAVSTGTAGMLSTWTTTVSDASAGHAKPVSVDIT
jgi:hypothetical protein